MPKPWQRLVELWRGAGLIIRPPVHPEAIQAFESGARLPERVDAVFETVGKATWSHSAKSLKPGGIIAVHISNRCLDLEPVVANVAKHFGFKIARIDFEENEEEWWLYSSSWILLTRERAIFDLPQIRSSMTSVKTNSALPLWTDDFSSLFQILKK